MDFHQTKVCALWSNCIAINGQFLQFLTELSACDTSVFSFPDDNISKCQWIFITLGVCISIVGTWFGIANG